VQPAIDSTDTQAAGGSRLKRGAATVAALLRRYGYVTATLAVVVSTAVFYPGRDTFAKGQWALLYLLVVALVAGACGTGPALLAACLAFLAWNFFFLPPYHSFEIHDVKDLVSLVAFLVVGTVVGVQTGRMHEREARAVANEKETALLNRFSASLVRESSTAAMVETLAEETRRLLGGAVATLFVPAADGVLQAVGRAGPAPADTLTAAAWCLRCGRALGLPARDRAADPTGWPAVAEAGSDAAPAVREGDVFVPLRAADEVRGVLHVAAAAGARFGARDFRVVVSLANLIAVFLQRQELQQALGRAEALREADQLKSSLLSSVSHELKTPLAGLTATVSNLLESDTEWEEAAVREELRAVIADVSRLTNSITALLDLSRLEAGAWTPRPDWYDLADLAAAGLAALPAHQRSRVHMDLSLDLDPVFVDHDQWARVFQHLLENALLYSGEDAAVEVGARAQTGGIRVWVEDTGPGIPQQDRAAIFQKFYRGTQTAGRTPSGTGLGLAITREIVVASGGSIWLEDVVPHGARFVVVIPTAKVEGQAG
jgi:two-component system, OmpR family, sensor histidine kinase KdpD